MVFVFIRVLGLSRDNLHRQKPEVPYFLSSGLKDQWNKLKMNTITNLLHMEGICNLDELENDIPMLENEFQNCSKDLSANLENHEEEMENHYEQNKSNMKSTNEISQELQLIEDSLGTMILEDLKSAQKSFNSLIDEVNEIELSISHVHTVCEILERLETLKECCLNSIDYLKMVHLMSSLAVLMNGLPEFPVIPFILRLKEMVNEQKIIANSLLKLEFEKKLSFVQKRNNYKMKICGNNLENLHSIIQAVYKNDYTCDLVTALPYTIWETLFLPLMKYKSEIARNEDEFCVIQNLSDHKLFNSYDEVYSKLILLIEYLADYFDCLIDDDLKLINFIGNALKERLSEIILQECVSKEIPKNWKDLPKFKDDLLESTQGLKDHLKPLGFMNECWEWINRIEEIYVQKKCKYFSDQAKELMRKDLHNMVYVGTPYDPSKAFMVSDEFLYCSISSYIVELIKLGDELIKEISEGPSVNRNALFATYKGIFFNYGDFVASYHQKLLETIPQQVALFYNNCMYLYRQLRTWNEMFETNDIFKPFCDNSQKAFYQVEEVGRMFFDSYVQEQKEQIQIILRGTNLQNSKTLENLEENTEKLFRQCLRQQELLKTVWSKVLSYTVYNQTIGDILNTMCDFLINSLVILEDIGACVAEKLIELFKIVLNRGVKLFTDSNEVFLYVPQWHKFNELVFILGASLLDINDRWADGKGPLALQFTPYELKQLIRALFQNSDRRAAVISRIHE